MSRCAAPDRELAVLVLLMAVATFFSSSTVNVTFVLGILLILPRFYRGEISLGALDLPLIAYGYAYLISGILGICPAYTFLYTSELKRLLIPYIVKPAISTPARLKAFFALTTAAGTLVGARAIYQWAFLGDLQPKAWSSTSTDMAVLLLMTIGPVVGVVAFSSLPLWKRVPLIIPGVLMFGGFLLAQNRSVLLGLLAGLFFTGLVVSWRRLAISLLVLLMLLLVVPNHFTRRYRERDYMDWKSSSTQYRMALYPLSLELFKDHAPFGIGRRNFIVAHEYYKPPGDEIKPNAHSNLLNTLVELGIPGVLAYVWLLLAVVVHLIRRIKRELEPGSLEAALTAGILLGFVGYHVAGSFIYNWGYSLPVTLMWAMVGVSYTALPPSSPDPAPEARNSSL